MYENYIQILETSNSAKETITIIKLTLIFEKYWQIKSEFIILNSIDTIQPHGKAMTNIYLLFYVKTIDRQIK